MRKTILCSVALATLTTLLAGCDQSTSVPTPEQAMEQEVLGILGDELPPEATEIGFYTRNGVQSCSIAFHDDEIGYVAMNQFTNLVPIVYTARRDGHKWEAVDNQYDSPTLESSSGRVGSEAISASDFRSRVRECFQLSQIRHGQLYSQSARAQNALSWAHASEERSKHPSVGDLPLALPIIQPDRDLPLAQATPEQAMQRLNSTAIPAVRP
jgi:hypothetical protein